MRRFETKETVVRQQVELDPVCDGCGSDEPYLTPVAIEVNVGEEYGSRDEYDCLVARASALVAAGSKSLLVTGKDVGETP